MMSHLLHSDFAVPVTLFLAQLRQDLLAGAPGWVLTALFGVFITLWFLREVGKLPGQGTRATTPEKGFTPLDGERLEKLYYLLAQRNEEGVERFLKLAQEQRAAHQVQRDILAELKKINHNLTDQT